MDVGGLAKGRGRQAEMKFQAMVSALKEMNYGAIGLGVTDLHLPAGGTVVGDRDSPPASPPARSSRPTWACSSSIPRCCNRIDS